MRIVHSRLGQIVLIRRARASVPCVTRRAGGVLSTRDALVCPWHRQQIAAHVTAEQCHAPRVRRPRGGTLGGSGGVRITLVAAVGYVSPRVDCSEAVCSVHLAGFEVHGTKNVYTFRLVTGKRFWNSRRVHQPAPLGLL